MRTIELTVDSKGQTTVQTRGFAGSACKEASRFLEQALGQATAETVTAEFYQNQAADQQLRQSS